ncbi:CarD family transcriptional regulator [Desulfotomaculum sp. 1211_IL3151]|uniref:CarD family transcriptional regulator n=1 Tax=Desulfotomaculum sp. 1211_IL3151 TaxID=3084055 RepID=UPI002FD92F5B
MFQVGDKVFYPMHGASVIEAIEEKEILGIKRPYYVMTIRGMQVMFPIESKLGIRPVVDLDILEDVITTLNQGESDLNLNPNQRYRNNMSKMKSGDIYQGAQVIRDLIRLGKKKTLAVGDKAMLDNAQQILLSELALVKGIAQEQAIDLLNEVIDS